MGETVRPPGGGGAGGEALGRSRGGFTTKIHLSADGRCRVPSLLLTAGQRADCTQFEPVMSAFGRPASGRAVSTTYGKRAYVYPGTVTVAATIIWLRT